MTAYPYKLSELTRMFLAQAPSHMRDYFQAVAAYYREKEQGSVPIDLMRIIRGMRVF